MPCPGSGREAPTGVHHACNDVWARLAHHLQRHHAAIHNQHVPGLRVLGKRIVAACTQGQRWGRGAEGGGHGRARRWRVVKQGH